MKQHMLTHKIRDMPQHVYGNSRQSSSPDNNEMKFSLSSNYQIQNTEEENESENSRHCSRSNEFIERASSRERFSTSPASQTSSVQNPSELSDSRRANSYTEDLNEIESQKQDQVPCKYHL